MIDIKELIKLMRNGYAAMDEDGQWTWFEDRPKRDSDTWFINYPYEYCILNAFEIKPAKNWKNSLQEINND